ALRDTLLERIESRKARVGIIGMGYVGLPLALVLNEQGFAVRGFDVDSRKVEALMRGACYIKHLDPQRVAVARETGRFEATTEFEGLREMDAVLVCVPTPLTPQREPDMSYVRSTTEQIR